MSTHKDRATLSLAMMVKDEERFLEDALLSAKNWADEMVVVDTGSTDRTVKSLRTAVLKLVSLNGQITFQKLAMKRLNVLVETGLLSLMQMNVLRETILIVYGIYSTPRQHGLIKPLC